ncbi:hypothetical protein FE697_019635 [Mumia zhuanghuii]|uniref:Uncharacterized protein n=2 Tax=Mumia TaxID=1546255 RepID=A0ABW1QSP8_9ACTN|nr:MULTISPECIES: hypothetical protein [Mumia]KAA1420092.1 hypothetical protein FE697_019635 [Mumia zhuanghuii]
MNETEPELVPEEGLEETGNYPDPDDGPQDDVDQARLPQYDDDLIAGATLEDEQVDLDEESDVELSEDEEE